MKYLTYGLAITLSAASVVCGVMLWTNEQESLGAVVLAGAIAGGLELSKFVLFPHAKNLKAQGKKSAYPLYSLAVLLLCLSVVATVAFLERASKQANNKLQYADISTDNAVNDLKALDSQIATISQTLQADADKDYRKRVYAESGKLNALLQEKQKLLNQISANKQISVGGLQSLFHSIADVTGSNHNNVRITAYTIAAILMDVTAIAMIMLLASTPATRKKPINTATREDEIEARILAGDYGHQIIGRQIAKAEKIGYRRLQPVLERLLKDEKLIKDGNKTYLAG